MKKLTLLLALIAFHSVCYCEELSHATKWFGIQYLHQYPQNDYTPDITSLTYTLEGDTLFKGITYQKICLTHEAEHKVKAYNGAIRQSTDGQKVYFIPSGSNNEYLLYDFSANGGDTVYAYNGFSDISCEQMRNTADSGSILAAWEILSTQTIDGRKHLKVREVDTQSSVEWIEGIGTKHILWPVGRGCYATGMEIRFHQTLCATDSEGNVLYSYDTDNLGIHNNNCEWERINSAVENAIYSTSAAHKILQDSHILILRGDKTYTLTGQEVKQ